MFEGFHIAIADLFYDHHMNGQYTYIVGKYKIYLYELYKQWESIWRSLLACFAV